MDINNIFDEISLAEELGLKDSKVFDLEQLRRTGNVFYIKKEDGDTITEIIDYTSFDGMLSFSKQFSYDKNEQTKVRLEQIDQLMKNAISREDYETAQQLVKEKENLK